MMPGSSLRSIVRLAAYDLPDDHREGDQDEDRYESAERKLRLALRSSVCRGMTQPPLFQAGYDPRTFSIDV
jgi:hypothetical protein